jgi:dipeptidase
VAIIPNYYVIDDFHKADTINILSSPDIIDYAEANGWYDSHNGSSFNFRKAYSHKDRLDAIWNIGRKWVIINQLAETRYDFDADFPFSIKPKHKVDIQTLIDALQNHYENTGFEYDPSLDYGSPHHRAGLGVNDTLSVCNLYNDYSCITQLRSWLPSGIGNIMWIAPRYPCIQPFIPWYYGINKISSDYEKATYGEALENYNNKNRNYIELYPGHSCWVFDEFANKVDSCYGKEIKSIQEWKGKFQTDIFEAINEKERGVIRMYESTPDKARQALTNLTNGFAERAFHETKEKLLRMKTSGR